MKKLISFALFMALLIPFAALSSEKSTSLPKEHVNKIKRIADFFAAELINRAIKTVVVEDFTDYNNKPYPKGKEAAKEFRKQLVIESSAKFSVLESEAEAIITGKIIPFKKGDKWKIEITAVSSDKKTVILLYEGIFQQPKKSKK
jgi:hypothetical protein